MQVLTATIALALILAACNPTTADGPTSTAPPETTTTTSVTTTTTTTTTIPSTTTVIEAVDPSVLAGTWKVDTDQSEVLMTFSEDGTWEGSYGYGEVFDFGNWVLDGTELRIYSSVDSDACPASFGRYTIVFSEDRNRIDFPKSGIDDCKGGQRASDLGHGLERQEP